MIREEDEDVVAGSCLNHSLSFRGCFVSLQDCEEVSGGHIAFGIIDLDSIVDINTGFFVAGFVEDLSFVGVIDIVHNIVICESDDSFWIKALRDKSLIGVEDVSLMPVVGVGV